MYHLESCKAKEQGARSKDGVDSRDEFVFVCVCVCVCVIRSIVSIEYTLAASCTDKNLAMSTNHVRVQE